MSEGPKTPLSEWLVAAAGAIVLAGMLGYLGWLWATDTEGPPVLFVEVEAVERAGPNWLVRFVAGNEGLAAAANVQISGQVGGAGAPEVSTVVLDYVPQQSERRGGLLFTRDPEAGHLQMRVEGYSEP